MYGCIILNPHFHNFSRQTKKMMKIVMEKMMNHKKQRSYQPAKNHQQNAWRCYGLEHHKPHKYLCGNSRFSIWRGTLARQLMLSGLRTLNTLVWSYSCTVCAKGLMFAQPVLECGGVWLFSGFTSGWCMWDLTLRNKFYDFFFIIPNPDIAFNHSAFRL